MLTVTTVLSTDKADEWEQVKAFLALTPAALADVDEAARTVTSKVQARWLNPDLGESMADSVVVVDP